MALKDDKDDIEARIRQAATEGKITYAETDEIDNYDDIAREFLFDIFGINFDECFISDESTLSDFASCCCPEEIEGSLSELRDICDSIMQEKILARYGIETKYYDTLVSVFEQIQQQRIALKN